MRSSSFARLRAARAVRHRLQRHEPPGGRHTSQRNGTDTLSSPSLEFRAIDPIHAHMAVCRAIENGVTLVRQADNGLSFVADPYGRIVAAVDHCNNGERVLVAQVPTRSTFTIYPYFGDLFAWLALAGFVDMVVWTTVRWRAAKRTGSNQAEGEASS